MKPHRWYLQTILILVILSADRPAHAQTAFRHPGVLVNQAQLDFIAAQVNAGNDPWTSAFTKASSSSYGSLSYTPKPWSTVECGPSSNPNFGCSDERNDALAAYTQALLWYITGNESYARNSIAIMNAWSGTLTGGHINSNAPLQAGWTGSVWAEAAEIIRYTYTGWSASDVDSVANMLATQYVPNLINGAPCKNGNWELIIIEALMHISVFNIIAAFEFHDAINNGGSAPSGINVGPTGGNSATMEIAYNHFVNRLGGTMPETAAQIDLKRPTGANYFLAWESLTHALVGRIGLSSGVPTGGAIDDPQRQQAR